MKNVEKIEDYKIPIEICKKYGIDLVGMSKSLFNLLDYCKKLKFELDLFSLNKVKKEAKIIHLNNQKDIALAIIGKPTKKEHYKSIIAIYEQYEKELNKLLL